LRRGLRFAIPLVFAPVHGWTATPILYPETGVPVAVGLDAATFNCSLPAFAHCTDMAMSFDADLLVVAPLDMAGADGLEHVAGSGSISAFVEEGQTLAWEFWQRQVAAGASDWMGNGSSDRPTPPFSAYGRPGDDLTTTRALAGLYCKPRRKAR
jgi:hypothetical protein